MLIELLAEWVLEPFEASSTFVVGTIVFEVSFCDTLFGGSSIEEVSGEPSFGGGTVGMGTGTTTPGPLSS